MKGSGRQAPWRERLGALARAAQHRMASGLGVDDAKRMNTVVDMLANNARRAPGYWIQLVLAMGIATLGLVLSSTAVVIGAMLVSPLMGPILELGMGFAVGSSILVMRASMRVFMSVVVVVAGAALMTLALPFHELTVEITTRTAPTALDLLVAAFCALTATYTTVRPGADSTAAAAGTAIGIALVPPLCVIGFGLGTFAPTVAGGASLLFTANLSAILVLSVLSFLLLGFNQVDTEIVERDFIDPTDARSDALAYRVSRTLHRAFGSRYGVAMRVLIPAVFLAIIFVPLRRALTEVTWEVRTRDAVRRIVEEISPHAVQTSLTVDRKALDIRLVVIATSKEARTIEDTLSERVTRAVGVRPGVSVVGVPDGRMLRELATASQKPAGGSPAPVRTVRERTSAAIHNEFPAEAGQLITWQLAMVPGDTVVITTYHIGPPLGDIGAALLGRALAADLGSLVRVRDVAFPATPFAAAPRGERAWLDSVRVLASELVRAGQAVACIRGPGGAAGRTTAAQRLVLAGLLETDAARTGLLTVLPASTWDFRVALERCVPAATPADSTGARQAK